MSEALIHRLYEAAADERQWPLLLQAMQKQFDTDAGWLLVFQGRSVLGAHATGGLRDVADTGLEQLRAQDDWAHSPVMAWSLQHPTGGFAPTERYFSAAVQRDDPILQQVTRRQLHNQAGAVLHLPQGVAVLGLARSRPARFGRREFNALNHLHGHWAQAMPLALHLARERARHTARVLQELGQAAAVLSQRGAVMACNTLFERGLADWAVLDAHDRVQPLAAAARAALARALAQRQPGAAAQPSLALRTRTGCVLRLRLLPLTGATRECFLGGRLLLTLEAVAPSLTHDAAQRALQRCHGLTPREAHLAWLLAGTDCSLAQAADALQISYASARTYLSRIYAKTQVHKQMDLVRLVLTLGAL